MILLFVIVYSVSFLDYKIGGIVVVEKVEEVKKEIDIVKERAISEIEEKYRLSITRLDMKTDMINENMATFATAVNDQLDKTLVFGSAKTSTELLKDRNDIVVAFNKTGTDKELIYKMIKPLNNQVVRAFKDEIALKFEKELHRVGENKIGDGEISALYNEFLDKLEEYNRDKIENYLKGKVSNISEYTELLDKLDNFEESKYDVNLAPAAF